MCRFLYVYHLRVYRERWTGLQNILEGKKQEDSNKDSKRRSMKTVHQVLTPGCFLIQTSLWFFSHAEQYLMYLHYSKCRFGVGGGVDVDKTQSNKYK